MRRALLTAVALLLAPAAAGALSLISQERQVDARAGYRFFLPPDTVVSEAESATDFSPFSATVDVDLRDLGVLSPSARGSATQESSIVLGAGGSLETTSSGNVEADAGTSGRLDGFSSGRSHYLLVFDLPSAQAFELTAAATLSGSSFTTQLVIELTRNDDEMVERLLLSGRGELEDRIPGVLDPGTYSLRVDALAGASVIGGGPSGSGEGGEIVFDVALHVLPEPHAAGLLFLGAVVALLGRSRTKMLRIARRGIVVPVLLVASEPASALSVPLQSREVRASAGYQPIFEPAIVDSETESASAFAPFSGVADADSFRGSHSTASQVSSLMVAGDVLEARSSGTVRAGAFTPDTVEGTVFSSAGSDLLITFELTSDQPYELITFARTDPRLSGVFGIPPSWRAQLLVELTRTDGDVIERMLLGEGVLDTETSGLLAAGTYSLRVDAGADARAVSFAPFQEGFGGLTFDVTLRVVPEPETAALLMLAAVAACRARPASRAQKLPRA